MEDLSIADYLAILRWRKKYFFLAFSIVWALALVFALCWSNYRSTATVEIEQPEVAPTTTTLIGMNSNDDMQEALADLRIGKIQQKVTAPSSLVDIISKFNLYPNARKVEPIAAIADRMRDKIKLDLISSTVANPAATSKVPVDQLSAIAFTLSFDYSDPHFAQQVTNELVTRFLDEDLKQRRAQAEATSDFLATQSAALEASMEEQEKKISEFQQAHGISKPEALMFNQQAAASGLMSLQGLDSQITSNEGTQGSIRAQLATVDPYSRVIADGQMLTTPAVQLKALEAQYTTLTAQYGHDHPDVVKTRHQIDALRAETGIKGVDTGTIKAQINDLRTNLAAAEKAGGSDNPDAIALRHQLSKLEEQLTAAGKNPSRQSGIKQDADNPAYLQFVAQLESTVEQHKALLIQREALAKQQAKYQEAVLQDPALEQQMASLSRDYDNAQLRYREMREKKMAADMDLQMIQDRKGQRLAVINPPEFPLKTHPSRLTIILGGLLLAILAGIGSVVLVQSINRNILGTRHLTALIGVAPMVTIPHLFTKTETYRIRRRRPLAIGATIFLALIAFTIFNFEVMPLDVLWSIFTQRIGLS